VSRRSSDRFAVRSRALVGLLVAIATAAAPLSTIGIAYAEPTAADLDSARELYKAGLELRKNGDERAALAKFKAAYALSKSPVIGVDVGKSHVALGELVEAREQYLDVDALPVSAKEGKASVDARAEATKLAAEIKPRIPTLKILLSGATVPPPKVTIDGAAIPNEALGQPRAVNPGTHTVGISNGGAERTMSVTVTEGESRDVPLIAPEPTKKVTTQPTTTVTPPPATTTTPPPVVTNPPPQGESKGTSPLLYVGIGLAGVGLAVGGITGAIALSKGKTLKDECAGSVCSGSRASDLDSAKTMALISNVGFAAAGAGVVLIIVGLTTGGRKAEPTTTAHVEPWVGVGSLGVTGAF
jgi:hypothetical protein